MKPAVNNTHEILIGPYRSGKSWLLLEHAIQNCLDKFASSGKVDAHDETVIIVPSQRYRRMLEKRIKKILDRKIEAMGSQSRLNESGSVGIWGLKILTFYQFCQISLLRAGIFSKQLPEAAKAPLVAAICKSLLNQNELKKLNTFIESSGAQSSILSLIDEWQRSGYTAADIIKSIQKINSDIDHRKELAQIYAAYEKAVEELKCLDHHGLVFKLIEALKKNKEAIWLSDFIVVDGFDRLNTLQIDLLKALAEHTEKLLISFDYAEPTDSLFEEYAWKRRSYEQIKNLLGKIFEFKSVINTVDNQKGKIETFVATDRLAEMSTIAAKVKAAIIKDNLHPEDIVITARNLSPYKSAIEAAFQDAEIAYYVDEPIALITLPIIRFLLNLLSLASEDFSRRQIIDCLRSPYFKLGALGLSAENVEPLNDISLQAKIVAGQSQWQKALQKTPQLLKGIDKLFAFANNVNDLSASSDAIAYVSVVEDLIDQVLDLSSLGDDREPFLIWKQKEALAQFRRQLAILIQEEEIWKKLKQDNKTISLYERLKELVERANFANASDNTNKVLVTSAELVPNQQYKQIYLAGLLEGEFPAIKINNGFLTAQEIEQWREINVSIYNPRMESGFEYALFASLINRASNKIILSYPLVDIASSKNEFLPSFFLSGLNIMTDDKQYEAMSFAEPEIVFNSMRNVLLYNFWQGNNGTTVSASVEPSLASFMEQLQEKLGFARIRSKQLKDTPVNGYLVDHVAATTVKINLPSYWNASYLNDYGKCPFNFWLNRMLKITPHEEPLAGLSIQDRGTFYHKALELFFKTVISNKLSMTAEKSVLDVHFNKAIEEALTWLEEQNWFRPDEFWPQQKNELVFRLQNFFAIEYERFLVEDGQYEPFLVEAAFGPDEQYPPLVLQQNGKEIKIRGKIDRIDIKTDSAGRRVRVVDYKSGSTYISRDDFESGRNLQLPLYALAIEKSIIPGVKTSNYQYVSIGTGKLLSGKRQEESDVQNDLSILKEKIFAFVDQIEKGDFSIRPSNDKVCTTCVHQRVCRIKEFPNSEFSNRATKNWNGSVIEFKQNSKGSTMSELWELIWGKPEVDPGALSQAIEQELDNGSPDFRTRLLIRDSTKALEHYWGPKRLKEWLSASSVRAKIEAIQHEDLGEPGFPLLQEHLMDKTKPETVKEFLRDLGSNIKEPVTLEVGGSIALILTGYLSRATIDLDIVDEVPASIRSQNKLLEDLQKRYHLLLTHFQSHYLPTGWKDRLHYLGRFGALEVYTADVYDIFLGKLFSERTKDLDDLRAIKLQLDKDHLIKQLLATTHSFLKEPSLKQAAQKNWYILFGENLPSS